MCVRAPSSGRVFSGLRPNGIQRDAASLSDGFFG
jgi:hypothetical protein